MSFCFRRDVRVLTCLKVINSAVNNFVKRYRTGFLVRKERSMPDFEMHKIPCEFAAETTASEAPELSGPLGNLVRLLFSEGWGRKRPPRKAGGPYGLTK